MKSGSIALATTLALLCPVALSVDIEDKDDFMFFAKRVSLGNTYKGKTVYLRNDIDLSGEKYTPMGILLDDGKYSYFQGTFDGQGHVISNLNATTSEISAGLFGIVYGGAVKNTILDSSCSVTIKNTQNIQSNLAGLIGAVYSTMEPVTIQNCINMAKLSVFGRADITLIGGIVGNLVYDGFDPELYNCVNMGDIHTEDGVISDLYIGGIVGYIDGKDSSYVLNCLNLGDVTVSKKTKISTTIGGIVGEVDRGYIFNSVNMGKFYVIPDGTGAGILSQEIVGTLVGNVSNCYSQNMTFNTTIKSDDYFGCGVFDENYMLLNEATVGEYTGKSLISALNAFTDVFYFYEMSRWLLNKNEKVLSFLPSKNNKKPIEMSSGLVLLTQIPDDYKHHFYGWYGDASFSTPFTAQEIDKDTTLYGKYDLHEKEYTLTFNTGGKLKINSMKVKFGDVVTLPEGIAGEERIGLWEYRVGDDTFGTITQDFIMPAYDISLYARWMKTVIRTPSEFQELSAHVSAGASCVGFTITLENDLDMEGVSMKSIGNEGHEFGGTFDGKGHTIKNLYIYSTGLVGGLFGYSSIGMTVRNLVLDKSCTIYELYYPSREIKREIGGVYSGGIIGGCYAGNNNCVLENSVNMGIVKFNGKVADSQSITGGLVGIFKAIISQCSIVNSVFLGTVQITGTYDYGYAGGIAGSVAGDLDAGQSKIENCLNGGVITANELKDTTYIGGIVGGFDVNTVVQNCVNIGSFEIKDAEDDNVTTGQITGFIKKATIQNCYWANSLDAPCYGKMEEEESVVGNNTGFNKNFNLDKSISTGSYKGYSLISALNSFTLNSNSLSKWTGNKNGASVSFEVDGDAILTVQSQIVLLPTFSSQGEKHFDGWYEDSDTKTIFTDSEVFEDMHLYGVWREAKAKYTVTFINEGNTVKTIEVKHGDKVKTNGVKVKKKGYAFIAWIDEYGRKVDNNYIMQTRDVILTALWLKESISSAKDLVEFSDFVGRGANCEGRVIRLNSDIDMSGVEDFVPIGTSENPFKGTFEGNGHKISNLKILTSAQYSGFFGNTLDATIRNIVFDESCSVESNYQIGYGSVGGVVGYCGTENRQCVFVNVINFAPVTYLNETPADTMNLGGVIGLCQGYSTGCTINNCANYGAVTKLGTTNSTWIGGVIGKCGGDYDFATCKVWNSVNYGKISHIGKTTDLKKFGAGGILGACYENTNVGACVNGGEMDIGNTKAWSIGGITGNNKDLCASIENLWFWWVAYSGDSSKNPEINEDMTTSDGENVLDTLIRYTKSRTLPKEGIGKTYKSTWVVNPNNATIKADVNKRTITTYNSTIVLLPTFRDGDKYHFHGWKIGEDDAETSEVSKDTTFTGEWKKSIDKKLVVGLSVGLSCFVVLVVVVILLSLYAMKYLKWRKERKNLRDLLYPKVYDKDVPDDSLNRKVGFYPEFYTRYGEITLREALKTAGLKEELALKVVDECYKKAKNIDEDKLPRGMTVDDAAVIAMYTFDFGTKELYDCNPYRIINNALRERKNKDLDKAKDLIYVLMKALRKIPIIHGEDLYRGIIVDAYDKPNRQGASSGGKPYPKLSDYAKGKELTWDALSSTSPDMGVTQNFLARNTVPGKIGILFNIKNGWGYDIQPFSMFPKESEILVEPERQFKVDAIVETNGLKIVNLIMYKTPILFPEVFGTHNIKTSSISYIKEKADNYGHDKMLKHRQTQNFDNMFSNDADWEGKNLETINEDDFMTEQVEDEPEMVRGFVGVDQDDNAKGGVEMQNLGAKNVKRGKN